MPRRTLLTLLVALAAFVMPVGNALADGGTPAPFGSALDSSQLIVTFKAAAGPAAVSDTLAVAGADQVGTVALSGAAIVAVPELATDAALATLKADPDVAAVRIDPVVQVAVLPNDPQLNANHALDWMYKEQNLPAAWNVTTGSAVTVAVIDTGVDASHEDMSGAVLPGYNAIDGSGNSADDNGHGTEVAGTVAARGNNGIGVAGSCWNCKILPVKVMDASGSGYASTISNGIVWATDHGAQIINISIGGPPDPSYVTALNYATAHGVFVAVAAGNNGSDWPTASYPGGYGISMPGVVSVGAADYNKNLYNFSNYGATVEVAAPGCAVTTTMDGGYAANAVCGTSIASPWLAGEAALALSYAPTLTPAQLEQKIEASANPNFPAQRVLTSGMTGACTGDYSGPCTVHGFIDDAQLLYALGAPQPPVAPSLSGLALTLSGMVAIGNTLSASQAVASYFTGTVTSYSYAWFRCDANGGSCSVVSAASGPDYTLSAADQGSTIKEEISASNDTGSISIDSSVSALLPVPLSLSGQPLQLQGVVVLGGELSASHAAAYYFGGTVTSYSYAWLRCDATGASCVPISSASNATYTLTAADQGSRVKEEISASYGASTLSLDSAASALLPVPPPLTAPSVQTLPTLTGLAKVGQTLSSNNGSWTGNPTPALSVHWLACTAGTCTAISGATGSGLVLSADQVGSTIKLQVTATNSQGTAVSTSAASDPVAAADPVVDPTPTPTPSGDGGGGGGGSGGGGSSQIPPQISLTVASSTASVDLGGQVGYTINVFSKNAGSATNMHLTVALPAAATMALGTSTRGGGCTQSAQTIDCNLDWLSPPLVAQVQLVVSFANAGAFTIPFAVSEQQTDADPSDNQTTAALTVNDPTKVVTGVPPVVTPVTPAPKLLTRPSLSGTFMVGQKLAASSGRWQGATSYRYSWKRCNANGSHCVQLQTTSRSYRLQAADRGKRISFTVLASNKTGTRQASSTTPVVLGADKHR